MILVKTKISKIFDIVETKDDIKEKLRTAISLDMAKVLIDDFISQGKILKYRAHYPQDNFDNFIYTSNIYYENIEAYKHWSMVRQKRVNRTEMCNKLKDVLEKNRAIMKESFKVNKKQKEKNKKQGRPKKD